MEQAPADPPPDPGPMTTRIVGELVPPDEPRTPAHPAPEQLEVTQPFIPAIRDETPEFAKRPNPRPTAAPPPPAPTPPAPNGPRPDAATAPPAPGPTAPPAAAPQPSAVPAPPPPEPPEPTAPAAPTPNAPAQPSDAEPASASPPPKRRSLARRVVRRIIGPDLLRKDPAPKKR